MRSPSRRRESIAMPTVFRTRRGFRVAVNSNDHPPPHVHVFSAGLEARYKLNCDTGPVELWDATEGWRRTDLNEIGHEIADRLGDCCKVWRTIHG